jgi:hypothetical protein
LHDFLSGVEISRHGYRSRVLTPEGSDALVLFLEPAGKIIQDLEDILL